MPAIDEGSILSRFGGDRELLCELIPVFLDQGPKLAHEIRGAIDCKDISRAVGTTRILKNSVSKFGQNIVSSAAQELECCLSAGGADAHDSWFRLEWAVNQFVSDLSAIGSSLARACECGEYCSLSRRSYFRTPWDEPIPTPSDDIVGALSEAAGYDPRSERR